MIPEINLEHLRAKQDGEVQKLRQAIENTGFLKVSHTLITCQDVERLMASYLTFFRLPEETKGVVDMARTGSNRGWGASQSEQVDPTANPDYKEVFDCGFELPKDDPLRQSGLGVYAPNLWPADMPDFRENVLSYYAKAMTVSLQILQEIADVTGRPSDYFADKFDRPMALLRGNYYPQRPAWAGEKDFGIASHTDYGCLTLLATDGTSGLEVQRRDGEWIPVSAQPGEFIVNFGEMLQMWTDGQVRATPHRVIGTEHERVSIPMFFNPNYDTNVSAEGAQEIMLAGDYLSRRYDETYVHLQTA